MITWTERKEGAVTQEELVQLQLTRLLVERLPSQPFEVSCHALARVLAKVIPNVYWTDGYFGGGRGWPHSWLCTSNHNILDPYPWAMVGGPVLICCQYFSPWPHLYRAQALSGLASKQLETEVQVLLEDLLKIKRSLPPYEQV